MARRRLPRCNTPDCTHDAWEYTIAFNEGIVEVNLCDDHASPLQAAMRHGKFTPRKGKRRRKFGDVLYDP